MKFHLDENVRHAIAEGLRRRGIDVTTSTETKLLSTSDETQLSFAASQDRGLLTQDPDFLRMEGVEHAGIVFWNQGSRTIGEVIKRVQLIHDLDLEMKNRIEYI